MCIRDSPYSVDEIEAAKELILKESGLQDAYVRAIAWRGAGPDMGVASARNPVRMAIAAREQLKSTAKAEGFDFDIEERGILHIYNNKKDYDHATDVNALLAEGGLTREAVSPADIKKMEPAITGDFYGGYFTASDATGDIHRYSRGLSEACKNKGVVFHFNSTVTGIDHNDQGPVVRWKDDK